jgi:general secretion pathway protein E
MGRADAAAIRRHAARAGMATLRDDGFAKAAAGVTSVAEILRATQDEDGARDPARTAEG